MRNRSTWLRRFVVLAGVLSLLAGCGGGGGGDGDGDGDDPVPTGPNALHWGDYFMVGLDFSRLPSAGLGVTDLTPCTLWGMAASDGEGTSDLVVDLNVDTELNPNQTRSVAYSVASDQALTIALSESPGVPILEGGVAADGRFAGAGRVLVDRYPSIQLFARRGGSYSDASLDGTYVLSGFSVETSALQSFVGTLTLEGDGTGAGSMRRNYGGSLTPWETAPLLYAVEEAGTTTMGLGSLGLWGGVVASGDVMLLGGGTAEPQVPIVMAVVRANAGGTPPKLDDRYFLVGYLQSLSSHRLVAVHGTLLADHAAETYTTSLTFNDGLTLAEDVAGGGTISIATTGVFTLTNTLGDVYTGCVSPDGDFATVGGTLTVGDPTFFVLFR